MQVKYGNLLASCWQKGVNTSSLNIKDVRRNFFAQVYFMADKFLFDLGRIRWTILTQKATNYLQILMLAVKKWGERGYMSTGRETVKGPHRCVQFERFCVELQACRRSALQTRPPRGWSWESPTHRPPSSANWLVNKFIWLLNRKYSSQALIPGSHGMEPSI